MTPRWIRGLYGILVCAVLVGWGGELRKQHKQARQNKHRDAGPARVGAMTPAMTLWTPKGEKINLKTYAGKWILLNFWATWCEPCRREMPSMERLARRYHKKKRPFVLLAASVDANWRIIRSFFRKHPAFKNDALRMKVLRDPDAKTSHRYGTKVFPETYLISPDGKVRWKIVGPKKWDHPKVIEKLEKIMKTHKAS